MMRDEWQPMRSIALAWSCCLPLRYLHFMRHRRSETSGLRHVHALLHKTGLLSQDATISPSRATFCFNTIIRVHLQLSRSENSIHFFILMLSLQIPPNRFTFPYLIQAAASFTPGTGKSLHAQVISRGINTDHVIHSCLVKFYGVIGEIVSAHQLFYEMPELDIVSLNSMLDALCKNGDAESAFSLSCQMPRVDVISWTTIINGFAKNQRFRYSLCLFRKMIEQGLKPHEATLVSILFCIAHLGDGAAVLQGKEVHGYITRNGISLTICLGTAVIDMYGKHGLTRCATQVFDGMPARAICTWNALITSLASNGLERDAICMFHGLRYDGLKPNGVTYVGLLAACSRAGMMALGLSHFRSMQVEFGIGPTMEHYGCLVDMLGRAGLLTEAALLIRKMPLQADGSVWGALLNACKAYGDVGLGEEVGKRLIELHPGHSGRYMLLTNLYAQAGRWPEAKELRDAMAKSGVKKMAGLSKISSILNY